MTVGEIAVRLSGRRGSFELDVDLSVPAAGVSVLFGKSGSGKTTLLRSIAGLERMAGTARIGSTTLQDDASGRFLPVPQRRVGYVFQEALLFPHLSVAQNLAYASDRARPGTDRRALDSVVEGLALSALLPRRPDSLSGGERQRVAIARALLSNPLLLLMDEPLSALDAAARARSLDLLERLRTELSIPMLYVTHSVDEAARLADRVAWLDAGSVIAVDSPDAIFSRLDVGRELGDEAGGLIRARVARHDDDDMLSELESDFGTLYVHRFAAPLGKSVLLRVRARDVSISLEREAKSSILNVLATRVAALEPFGRGEVLVGLACPADPDQMLLARVMKRSAEDLGLRPGLDVYARVKGVTLR